MLLSYLDDHFPAPVKLAELIRHGVHLLSLCCLVLDFEIIERPVDAAYLAMRPPLDPMPAAQTLQGRHGDVHRLFLFVFVVGDGDGESWRSDSKNHEQAPSRHCCIPR